MEELRCLARYINQFCIDDIPCEIIRKAKYCVLDSIGSAIGAATYEEIPSLAEELFHWTGKNEKTNASIWTYNKRTNLFDALLLNGIMGHALELDDVHTGSKSHIGAVVVVAAWTMADAIKSSGKDFLAAVIIGYEVMSRIGMAMDIASNRKRGWHTTGIIGTFGAAAAGAYLLKLDEEKTLSALGMAGTQSSGLWAFLEEGSTCKKLHPARAIVNGVTAAILAKGGMTGPSHILDATDGGLYSAVSDKFDMSIVCKNIGEGYEINNIDKKPYPCCRTTHHAIDAALFIAGQKSFDPKMINNVLVETYEIGVLQCGFSKYPTSGVEAKFSIPYTSAAAFVYGEVTQKQFLPDVLSNPLVKNIAQNTAVVSNKMFTERYPKCWGSRMTVILKDGNHIIKQIDDMSGSINAPLTPKQEKAKFLGLAEAAYPKKRAAKIMEEILCIDKLNTLPELA